MIDSSWAEFHVICFYHYGCCYCYLSDMCDRHSVAVLFLSPKGTFPVSMTYSTTPALQMST
eukprot:2174907-Prorocentrum_lima.AAC.1